MPSRRNSRRALARDSFALALAAPEVIARRAARMWLAGNAPSRRDRAELNRMSAEKIAAFYESWNAMMLETYRANVRLALSSMGWAWPARTSRRMPATLLAHGRRAVAGVLGAGLAPVSRRATSNAKRLRRGRR